MSQRERQRDTHRDTRGGDTVLGVIWRATVGIQGDYTGAGAVGSGVGSKRSCGDAGCQRTPCLHWHIVYLGRLLLVPLTLVLDLALVHLWLLWFRPSLLFRNTRTYHPTVSSTLHSMSYRRPEDDSSREFREDCESFFKVAILVMAGRTHKVDP